MHKIWQFLRETWRQLGCSIFVGDRYEKNVRGIAVGAALIVLINVLTGTLNVKNGYHMAAISSLSLILAGSLILYLLIRRKNRRAALTVATIAISIIYSFDAIAATDGIVIFWTLLFPWAFCYLASVKTGIFLSGYFSVLYIVLFYNPLWRMVEGKYPEIIVQRFPILYMANAFLCIYIMVQYHKNTLHQLDYAEQLLEAKRTADRANAAKSEFLTNMSHEIRTPINAMLGMNEIVLRESLQARDQPPREREMIRAVFSDICNYAGDIGSAGKSLLSIINDILDFSMIESGKMKIIPASYRLSSLLNDMSNMILFKARAKGLDFQVDVDETIPDNLNGDENRVRQIMTNILNNAVKYTDRGGIRLSVSAGDGERREGAPLDLLIVVRDTGIGIREEDIGRLFTKFERVDLEHNSTVEGTGLGLAIVRNLLDLMGGRIEVESVYGEGSTFSITLPQVVLSLEPIGNFREKLDQSLESAKAKKDIFRAPDAHILIVDDTRMNLTVAVNLLKGTRIGIDTAISGAEAIALCKTIRYDLILMDQRMPEMDGTEAMRRILAQADGANHGTRFICLTADAVSGARERYLAEGFADYLTKPIDSRALEMMLMKYLPQDKVERIRTDVPALDEEGAMDIGEGFEALRPAGVDPSVGLQYCQNDPDFYRSMLVEYAQGASGKLDALRTYLDQNHLNDYAVAVHSLKSTSRMIGAITLSEAAARLEAAADAGDSAALREGHDAMCIACAKLCKAIEDLTKDAPAEETQTAGDDEILEFLPED